MTNQDLLNLVIANIRSGNSDTRALDLRQVLNSIIASFQNTLLKNVADGYMGIDSAGNADFSLIRTSSPTQKSFLRDDGTFQMIPDVNALQWKPACRAMSNSDTPITGLQTLDTISLIKDNLAFLPNQNDPIENGPWVVKSGAWVRPIWFDSSNNSLAQSTIRIEEGATYAGTEWVCQNVNPVQVGIDNITFTIEPALITNQIAFGDVTGIISSSNKYVVDSPGSYNRIVTWSPNLSSRGYIIVENAGATLVGDNLVINSANDMSLIADANKVTTHAGSGFTSALIVDKNNGARIAIGANIGTTNAANGFTVEYGNVYIGGNTTAGEKLEVNGNIKYVNQYSASATPSIVAGAAIGTAPSVSFSAGSTNKGGKILITTGTTVGSFPSGTIAVITFSNSFTAPNGSTVVLGSEGSFPNISTTSGTTGFTLEAVVPALLLPSTSYIIPYITEAY